MKNLIEKKTKTRYKINPFVKLVVTERGIKKISNKQGDQMLVINKETGEQVAQAGFWQIAEVDQTQFVKLYINGVRAFTGLTQAGAKVFEILYTEVQNNISKDVVTLSFNAIDQDVNKISRSTFSRGINELIDRGFIALTLNPSQFFLNPDYIWNGDRLSFVKEFRKKNVEQISRDMQEREKLEELGQSRLLE